MKPQESTLNVVLRPTPAGVQEVGLRNSGKRGASVRHGAPPDATARPPGHERSAVTAFLNIYGQKGSSPLPHVRMIGAWNEPNRDPFDMQLPGPPAGVHPVLTPGGQHMEAVNCPSPATANNCGPNLAASYWKAARDAMNSACSGSGLSGCYAVAGEFDSGFGSDSQLYWTKYADQITSNFPKQISFHGHHDVDGLGPSNHYGLIAPGSDLNASGSNRALWWYLRNRLPAVAATASAAAANPDADNEGTIRIPEGDVDADGYADLVTLHSNGTGSVFPGQADSHFGTSIGSFAGTMDPAQYDGTGHYVIDVEDVNGDLHGDLVTLTSSGTACVYPGRDDGTFGLPASHRSPADGTWHPVFGRVTGDHRADLVTFYNLTGVVLTYPGQANGTFADGKQSFAGSMDSSLFDGVGHELDTVVDVNGDGFGDLVTAMSSGDVAVYSGHADGSFTGSATSFSGTFASARFNHSGHELAMEKPAFRRKGCAASGC